MTEIRLRQQRYGRLFQVERGRRQRDGLTLKSHHFVIKTANGSCEEMCDLFIVRYLEKKSTRYVTSHRLMYLFRASKFHHERRDFYEPSVATRLVTYMGSDDAPTSEKTTVSR